MIDLLSNQALEVLPVLSTFGMFALAGAMMREAYAPVAELEYRLRGERRGRRQPLKLVVSRPAAAVVARSDGDAHREPTLALPGAA